jgi:flagellar basal body-associated protein FliL
LLSLGNLVILVVCFAAAISAAAAVAGASGQAESVQKEARANKKSKWDKVSI